ncbi:hypothetical protein R1flu_007708 [Riccia fluitans]|uniref:CHAT domain-containing protein n=1 Tax=Riccia fluitans TaxID=41844 RepID=A0ABD1YZL8_9MARC
MLTTLHTLLVKPAKEFLKKIGVTNPRNWIFMPQGCLSLIPFHALYDEVEKKFLIEQAAVGVAPSFRALHNCFYRQWLCDKSPALRKIFVAGNPKPMGGRKPQLQGAEEEVREVAAILGVEPHVGTDCSKEAVRQGLSKSRIVLLATHGMAL